MTNEFNRSNLREIRADLETALKFVGEKHGISFDIGNISFMPENFRCKIEARTLTAKKSAPSGSGVVANGTKFRVGGTTYTVTGFHANRPKWPYVGVGPQGGRYKFTRDQVHRGMDIA